jgi:hypothetical protein
MSCKDLTGSMGLGPNCGAEMKGLWSLGKYGAAGAEAK